MATVELVPSIFRELADLFASGPTLARVLRFRPSKDLQRRVRALLLKQNQGKRLTDQEQQLMDECQHAEYFMQLLKAKIRAGAGPAVK